MVWGHEMKTKIVLIFYIVIIVLFFQGCSLTKVSSLKIKKGLLNLEQWDFKEDGNIKLNGDWEFYWNQSLTPDEIEKSNSKLTGYYPVPLYWTKYADLNLPAKGKATYRMVIKADKRYKALSIKTPEIYTEYCIWVNGDILDSSIGTKSTKPIYLHPNVYTFSNDTDQIEIILQIKNTLHSNAGIGQAFILGTPDNVYSSRIRLIAMDLITLAICIFFGVYHLILFIVKKNEYELLYFVIFCISVSVRGIMSNETLIMQIFPNMPFIIGSKIITASIPTITGTILLYFYYMFKKESSKRIMWLFVGINMLYLLIVAITGSYFYSFLFNYYLISVILVCLLILFETIKLTLNGNKDILIFLAGAIFVIISALNDMLFFNQLINTGYCLALGLVMFSIAQSILLAIRILRLSKEKQTLYEKLNETGLAFMQAQIKPHFIYNALSTIINMTIKNPKRTKELLLDFSDYLRACFNFDNIKGMTTVKKEMETVKAYLSIEKARFGDRLNVVYDVTENPRALIPVLCIQPIVENAVRHGIMSKIDGGTIKISVRNEDNSTYICIEDDGVGMDEMKLTDIFNDENQNGVGIKNVNSRLKIRYGKGLHIKSRLNKGTVIQMVIPQNIKRKVSNTYESISS